MAKENNLTDFLTDVADAIREKKGTTDKINPQDFSEEIKSIKTSTSIWTGHVDVEGLKAIGWDDDDIAYFQEHGVNWMEEDDECHKVPEDNKALYGVINYSNYKNYADIIVYLPKIDTSGVTNGNGFFEGFKKMVAIPMIDTSAMTKARTFFYECSRITVIPLLDFSNVTDMHYAFSGCYSLQYIPHLNIKKTLNITNLFSACHSLITANIEFGHPSNAEGMFYAAYSIKKIPEIDISFSKDATNMVLYCYCLRDAKIKGLSANLSFRFCRVLHKESLLYIIKNAFTTEDIIITLHSEIYNLLSVDDDILNEISEERGGKHTNISLASA